jgi:recombination protein RecR
MMPYPKILLSLIEQLKKLPGVGKKSAERFAFRILEWSKDEQQQLAHTLSSLHTSIRLCSECGCFQDTPLCSFCSTAPHSKMLCVIATPKDAYAIAQTKIYHGHYHVLGCLLSPLEGKTAEHLHMDRLQDRIQSLHIHEMILALDPTLEGDTTALYLHEHFSRLGLKVTRLALGLPVGSSLDFIDAGTLSQAFSGRHPFYTVSN